MTSTPGTPDTVVRMRTIIRAVALVALPLLLAPTVAEARDANCKRAKSSQSHTFKDWVPMEGVGLVMWRADMRVTTWDRCDHGELTVTYGWQNGAIEDNDLVLKVTSVRYRTSSSGKWRADNLRQGACAASARRGCILVRNGGHFDLSRKTRVTHVRLTTALIYDPNTEDDSIADSKAFAPRTWTCDVRYAGCKKPKKPKKPTKKQKPTKKPGSGGKPGPGANGGLLPPPGSQLPSANGGDLRAGGA